MWVSSSNALYILKQFFSDGYTSDFQIRSKASKQIVVITDDNARGILAPEFKEFVNSDARLKGKTTFNGFVWLDGVSTKKSWCTRASQGAQYVALGQDAELGGLIQDLCTKDWSQLFETLAQRIIKEEVQKAFVLDEKVDGTKEIAVEVNGAAVESSHFRFEKTKNAIVFWKNHAPVDGDKIKVTYFPKP